MEHNTGNTKSEYTSWTYDKEVAKNFALRPNGGGIVLKKSVPSNKLVESPSLKDVQLKQNPKKVTNEKEVLVEGRVSGASVEKINPKN